ncbi:hypothetical protein FGG08_000721 [Glutinoglossum americanum]|uniref:SWIM-type domain-containing protein n=1 Tax=Glutinoglossum americanum TaxID=1670608 RepID=A0A9P8I8C3_9PEZI|nr:hypothetical protein FGG08_000721 [Glutinoglossum americanum]
MTAQLSSSDEGRVIQANNDIYIISLRDGTCFCRQYQANSILCGHAITCIFIVTAYRAARDKAYKLRSA